VADGGSPVARKNGSTQLIHLKAQAEEERRQA
jgi:hypothetical protein